MEHLPPFSTKCMNGKQDVSSDDLACRQMIKAGGIIPTLNNIICIFVKINRKVIITLGGYHLPTGKDNSFDICLRSSGTTAP